MSNTNANAESGAPPARVMENERLRITLDHTDKTYTGGDMVKGEIWINLTKRTKIRAIRVQFSGKGKCKWMELLSKSSSATATADPSTTKSLFYTSKMIFAHDDVVLPEFAPNGLELSAGVHTFPFSMQLYRGLPSSLKGSYGSIKYKLRVVIQRPWSFDERHVIPITVYKWWPVPLQCRTNPQPLERQTTKTISLFGTRPITLLAILPEEFGVRGEPLRICATVTNNSTTNVEKVRFTILQYVCYTSKEPIVRRKVECLTIASKETGSVQKKTERSFAHEILIPDTAQPSDDGVLSVIGIAYVLRVEAVLRGLFKNLIINMPFTVYSSLRGDPNGEVASALPAWANNFPYATYDGNSEYPHHCPTPFDAQTISANMNSSLNSSSSIDSPSRSSQYSESSSIHSTTSDSSAVTLSPAIHNGGRCLSYASAGSGSSQLNSPSARMSVHSSSNVPYMPYSSSPAMVNSYPPANVPPYPLPESPQYTLLAEPRRQHTPAPAVVASTSASTSSAIGFHFGHVPPGAHELPPSYEELFGNATAPPSTPK